MSSVFLNLWRKKHFFCSYIWEFHIQPNNIQLSHKSPERRVQTYVTGSCRGTAFSLSKALSMSLSTVNALIYPTLKAAILTVFMPRPTPGLPFSLVFYVVLYGRGQLWEQLCFLSIRGTAQLNAWKMRPVQTTLQQHHCPEHSRTTTFLPYKAQ